MVNHKLNPFNFNVETFKALNKLRSKNKQLKILLHIETRNNSSSIDTAKITRSLKHFCKMHDIDGVVLEEQFLMRFLGNNQCQELQVH